MDGGNTLSSSDWRIVGLWIVFTTLAFLAVVARWYTRLVISRSAGAEDILLTISMILSIIYTTVTAIELPRGLAPIVPTSSDGEGQADFATTAEPLLFLLILSYVIGTILARVSILTLYMRVFRDRSFRKLRMVCWVLYGLLVAVLLWTIFSVFLRCTPVRRNVDPSFPGKCYFDDGVVWLLMAIMNLVLDIAIWGLPLFLIKQLRLQRLEKYGLVVVFLLGGIVCAASLARSMIIVVAAMNHDLSGSVMPAATWSGVEANVGIICACSLCFRPLLRKIPASWRKSQFGYRSTARTSSLSGATLEGSHSSTISESKPLKKNNLEMQERQMLASQSDDEV